MHGALAHSYTRWRTNMHNYALPVALTDASVIAEA